MSRCFVSGNGLHFEDDCETLMQRVGPGLGFESLVMWDWHPRWIIR